MKDNLDTTPGGVLRYISDGEVQSPFLGLKLAIWDFFRLDIFLWTFFDRKILAGTFFRVDKKCILAF